MNPSSPQAPIRNSVYNDPISNGQSNYFQLHGIEAAGGGAYTKYSSGMENVAKNPLQVALIHTLQLLDDHVQKKNEKNNSSSSLNNQSDTFTGPPHFTQIQSNRVLHTPPTSTVSSQSTSVHSIPYGQYLLQSQNRNQFCTQQDQNHSNPNSTQKQKQRELEWKERKERLKKYADKLEVHKERRGRGVELDSIFQNLLLEASHKLQHPSHPTMKHFSGKEEKEEESQEQSQQQHDNKEKSVIDRNEHEGSSSASVLIREAAASSAFSSSSSTNTSTSATPQFAKEELQHHIEQGLRQLLLTIISYNDTVPPSNHKIKHALDVLLDTKDVVVSGDSGSHSNSSTLSDAVEQARVSGVISSASFHDSEDDHDNNEEEDEEIHLESHTASFHQEKEKHPNTILKEHEQQLEQEQQQMHQNENHLISTENEGMVGVKDIPQSEQKDYDFDDDDTVSVDDDRYLTHSDIHDSPTPSQQASKMEFEERSSASQTSHQSPQGFLLRDRKISNENKVLIGKLYSHLLPYGILSTHPPFDSNEALKNRWIDTPEEEDKGYTTHSLTKSYLIELENDFQTMVRAQLEDTEGDLLQTEERSDEDEQFEQDLKAAEDLLEQEEKRANAVAKGVALGGTMEDMGGGNAILGGSKTATAVAAATGPLNIFSRMMGPTGMNNGEEEDNDDESAISDQVEDMEDDVNETVFEDENGNPIHVKKVKKIGLGKEGDLEKFSLPIIYNALQTGFEPTKDLVLEQGTIVAGQYLVESELGSAAFSTAYRCIDLTADPDDYYCEVCLKVIKNTKDFFDQSLDEIKVLELLRQTGECEENNILEMRSFFYFKEHLIIVTELLRQNLFEFGKFISDNNEIPYFTMTRLCYITRQVLIALNFIHNIGLIHSDVKPENILIASYSRARVKLIDFGSSCYFTDRQSSYIQSRSYRAPEVILGLPYSGKIDIWSLGCVVAEMFTGQVTFQNSSIVSMLSRMEAICEPFPRHLIMNGKYGSKFFTPNGLLYEKIGKNREDDRDHDDEDSNDYDEEETNGSLDEGMEDDGEDRFKLYTPKRTTLAERLGFEADLMERQRDSIEDEEKALFTDFIRSLLTIDPECRPTAAEALRHPWILSGENLTEADIKYSPEET